MDLGSPRATPGMTPAGGNLVTSRYRIGFRGPGEDYRRGKPELREGNLGIIYLMAIPLPAAPFPMNWQIVVVAFNEAQRRGTAVHRFENHSNTY